MADRGLRVRRWEWRFREDMEFANVELAEPIQYNEDEGMEMRIDRYHLLVVPRPHEDHFNELLLRRQI